MSDSCPPILIFFLCVSVSQHLPHSDYVESLPVLEGCGFDGIVVMLTARRLGPGKPKSRLRLLGPYEKLDIQDPEVMEYLLNGRPAPWGELWGGFRTPLVIDDG